MPLTLITGPANAGKAGAVLEALRTRLDEDPVLVVPTYPDVLAYQRELAAGGAVFGVRVVRFEWLIRDMAKRAGSATRVLGAAEVSRLVEVAVERARPRLGPLALAAEAGGFAAAAESLISELGREEVTPRELAGALLGTAGGDAQAYGRDIASIYGHYRTLLEELGVADEPLHASRTLDTVQASPETWGTSPVFVYGFDDLTGVQRRAVAVLAGLPGVDVVVGLTWEERVALAGRRRTWEALRPIAERHVALEARAEHYAPASRAALHHLERGLFEDGTERAEPGGAVRLLEAGGERAEAELVASEVLELLRAGMAPEEIAVVFRSPAGAMRLVTQVFAAYGIPTTTHARAPLDHTALGRGLVGLLRCALHPDPEAGDLLAYLRTPGVVRLADLVDRLEGEVRRDAVTSLAGARALWEASRWPLEAIDRLRAARERGPVALLERAETEAHVLFAAPRRRAAALLDDDERPDAGVFRSAREALRGLGRLAAADPALAPAPDALPGLVARLEVPAPAPRHEAVAVLGPLEIRARRVRALFVCGLQEGEFPRPGRADPFLSDQRRAELAERTTIDLRRREDVYDDERALFYACASRPTDLLVLSSRVSDEEGRPAVRSFFVDDVDDLFTHALETGRRSRPLSDVTWPAATAPTTRERARAAAVQREDEPPLIAGLADPEVLAELSARPAFSAGAIEGHAGCPVQWFVDRYLRPADFEPPSEPLARGNVAHRVLEVTLQALKRETGSARVTPATLGRATEICRAALEEHAPDFPISPDPARRRAIVRRLEADLLRYLRGSAQHETAFEPEHFELGFGGAGDELAPLALDGATGVSGRVDRIDVHDGRAAVVDYKGSKGYPVARWAPDGRLQVALYLLAVRDLLGLEPAAGFYQPISGPQAPRGAVLETEDLAAAAIKTDRVSAEGLDEALCAARDRAVATVAELRGGVLEPRPRTCGWANECLYPTVCRCAR